MFGLNLTLAAFMLYVMIRHAGRTPGLAADGFATERKTAVLLQAAAVVVAGVVLLVIAVTFYLAVSMVYLIKPFREVDIHARRAAPPRKP